MEKNGIKQNVSAAVSTLPLQHLVNAVLCAIWMLGKTSKSELIGANICPEDRWADIREELLSQNLIQQFGIKRGATYAINPHNVDTSSWVDLLRNGVDPIEVEHILALKALAIEKGGSINAWDAYKLIGQGAWWHGLREAVVESELLDVTGKRRGTRYVVAGGVA
tara:strand:+ start:5920 stop:6414 length:495 start_codon:yes stop_codon:yes gene_type:complete